MNYLPVTLSHQSCGPLLMDGSSPDCTSTGEEKTARRIRCSAISSAAGMTREAEGVGKDTLLPLGDFDRSLLHSFEPVEDSPPEILYESVPLTFDRQISQRRFARLARVGDPLIDAFAELLKTDDRGIAFAMWRYRPDMADLDSPAELAFRFDFVVEADAVPALRVLGTQPAGTHTAIRRTLDGCFPPLPATIWLDSNLQMIRDVERIGALSRSYNAEWNYIDTARVRDFNLNRDVVGTHLATHLPA